MPVPVPVDARNMILEIDNKLSQILSALGGMAGLIDVPFDQIVTSYTGTNLTLAVYKLAGVTVATLTMTYVGNQLVDTVRT